MNACRSSVARAAVVFVAVTSLSACGGHSLISDGATNDYGLIQADFNDCKKLGQTVASYLDTGKPTDLDPQLGDNRQTVLALSGSKRELQIRQFADEAIQNCDDSERRDKAAAAQARADAVRRANQNEIHAVATKECDNCSVDMIDKSGQPLIVDFPIGPTGRLEPAPDLNQSADKSLCESGRYDDEFSVYYKIRGVWNQKYGLCIDPNG